MEEVAKILKVIAENLLVEHPELEMTIDVNCQIVMNDEDAIELLDVSDYELVDWEPFYIGAPRPKKRK